MADEPLHPKQGSAKGEHDNGYIRPAAEAEVQQDHDGQSHHDDESSAGLKFSVHLNVHALTKEKGYRGAVMGAQVPFKVHVRPFSSATCPFGFEFQAFFFGVLWRMEDKFAIGQTVASYSEAFIAKPDFLLLMSVLPYDFPTHFLEFGAVELNQQPCG